MHANSTPLVAAAAVAADAADTDDVDAERNSF